MLELALDGKGAFGRFKHALDGYPREAERWYAMKQAWFDQQIREWLHDLEIAPIRKQPGS
jgi:hypothetical protein